MNQNVMPHSGIIWQPATQETMPPDDLEVLAMNAKNEAAVGTLHYDEREGIYALTSNGQFSDVVKWAHITDYVFPELHAENEQHMMEYLQKFYVAPDDRVLRYAFILRELDGHLRLSQTVQLQTLPTDEELSWAAFHAAKESGLQRHDFMQGWGAAINYIKKLMQIE